MKIYTRTGDLGKSSLFSGERVSKNHARIKTYGEVDELNSVIGALIAFLTGGSGVLEKPLREIQSDLFQVGAWLATVPDSPAAQRLAPFTAAPTQRLEQQIDALQAELPELRAFILPGGHKAAAWAHLARTVCRRAERTAIDLIQNDAGQAPSSLGPILTYLNRLSDYLFVAARFCNHSAGLSDILWQGPAIP
jgi:cob(I)alamin adenosyltransferase